MKNRYLCNLIETIIHFQFSIFNSMADNYLERQRDAYEARKAAWEKKKKHAAALKKAAARTTGDGAEMLHPFASPTEGIELPRQFTYPFAYTPHPLCLLAAHEVQQYLAAQTQ